MLTCLLTCLLTYFLLSFILSLHLLNEGGRVFGSQLLYYYYEAKLEEGIIGVFWTKAVVIVF